MKKRKLRRLGSLMLAAAIASPPFLAGCAALAARDAPATAQVAHRVGAERIAIEQVRRGGCCALRAMPGGCVSEADAKNSCRPRASTSRAAARGSLVSPCCSKCELSRPGSRRFHRHRLSNRCTRRCRRLPSQPRRSSSRLRRNRRCSPPRQGESSRRSCRRPDAPSAIEIRGRTDELGSAAFNELLARNRALAVRDYLRAQHLPEMTTIRLSFKGACCYVAGNDTAEGRAANRRVEIEWQPGVQVAQRSAS